MGGRRPDADPFDETGISGNSDGTAKPAASAPEVAARGFEATVESGPRAAAGPSPSAADAFEATVESGPRAAVGLDATLASSPPARDSGRGDRATFGVGHRLGRYEITRVLGQGGMGVVYAARDPQLARGVALKVLRPELSRDADETGARERLLREGRAAARLAHPNVVTVFDVGEHDGVLYVAMELVDGTTLREWLTATQRTWREILAMFAQAARGLSAAHDAGLVHRDFKPDNVLVGRDGRARVTDFGLVRAIEGPTERRSAPRMDQPVEGALTEAGAIMGTPAYMPLEQLDGDVATTASDQFSFCASLWEALYKERPFAGTTLAALRDNIAEHQLRNPGDTRVPRRIAPILARGLAANPADRWPSIAQLEAQLARDPARTLRRAAIGTALLAVGSAGALLAMPSADDDSTPCPIATARFDGIWDAGRKQVIERAMRATGVPYANTTFATVTRDLDAYRDRWLAVQQEACLAHDRKEQTAEQHARRDVCLDARLDAMRTLTDALAAATVEGVERATATVAFLPRVEDCADLQRLMLPAVASTAQTRTEAARLRQRLWTARQQFELGATAEALATAQDVVNQARRLEDPGLLSHALAFTAQFGGENPKKLLEESVVAAEAAGDDLTRLGAYNQLVFLHGVDEQNFEEAERVHVLAAAIAQRVKDPYARADVHTNHGAALQTAGKFADAVAEYERALAIYEKEVGPNTLAVSRVLANLGTALTRLGDEARAEQVLRRNLDIKQKHLGEQHPSVAWAHDELGNALSESKAPGAIDEAIELQERAIELIAATRGVDSIDAADLMLSLGITNAKAGKHDRAVEILRKVRATYAAKLEPNDPRTALIAFNLAEVLVEKKLHADARTEFEYAAAILEKALGPDHPYTAMALFGIGEADVNLGRPAKALAMLERALAIRAVPGATDPLDLAETKYTLARALWDAKRDRARARTLANEARRMFAENGDEVTARKVDDWLASRR